MRPVSKSGSPRLALSVSITWIGLCDANDELTRLGQSPTTVWWFDCLPYSTSLSGGICASSVPYGSLPDAIVARYNSKTPAVKWHLYRMPTGWAKTSAVVCSSRSNAVVGM